MQQGSPIFELSWTKWGVTSISLKFPCTEMSHHPWWAQTGPWHLLPKGTVFNLSTSDRICSLLWNQWRLSLALHVLRGEGATVPSGSILICCAVWSLEREMSLPVCQPLTYHPTRRKQSCKSQCWKQLLRLSHPPPLFPGALDWTGAELSSKALRI